MAAPPTSEAALPPAELVVRLAPTVRVHDRGRLLLGGAPPRLVRLSQSGAALVDGWRRNAAPVGDAGGAAALARRLLDAAILDAAPCPVSRPSDISIVVPVRDRAEQLDRCLAAVAATVPHVPITVVDDGSHDPVAVERVAMAHGARLVRHRENRGPSAARNTGLARTSSSLVAFIDSDVVVGPDHRWLGLLAAHFADPRVGAAAPRVLALDPRPGVLAGYERRRSSLDMGVRGGTVGPGRWTSYVPGTTLVVRRDAVPGGGFDPTLDVGEDVDFVWRMHANGWLVVYDPRASVRHEHRLAPAAFLSRRRAYAMSIAPLARRHPDAVSALGVDEASLAIVALVAAGRPRTALAVFAWRALRLRRRLKGHTDRPAQLAIRLVASGPLGTARGLSHAIRRAWSPLLLPLAPGRPRVVALLAVAELVHLVEPDGPRRPTDLALDVVNDLVAAAGTWEGCLREGTVRPLMPARHRQV